MNFHLSSYHFQDETKNNPTIFTRSMDKLFPVEKPSSEKQKSKPIDASEKNISPDFTDEKFDEVSMDELVLPDDVLTLN